MFTIIEFHNLGRANIVTEAFKSISLIIIFIWLFLELFNQRVGANGERLVRFNAIMNKICGNYRR